MLRNPNPEQYICDKLLEMMEETPFSKITVKALCSYAKISRTSFYNYFDSIYSVIQKIEDDFFEGLVAEDVWTRGNLTNPSNKEIAEAILLSTAKYLYANLHLINTLTGVNGEPSFTARLIRRTRKVSRQFNSEFGNNTSDLKENFLVEYCIGGQIASLQWLARHESEVDFEEFYQLCLWSTQKSVENYESFQE